MASTRRSKTFGKASPGWRRGVGASVLLLLTTVFGVPAAKAAGVASPYTITTSGTSGLTDGQRISVTVTTSDPVQFPVADVDIALCAPGVNYKAYTDENPIRADGPPRCGFTPGSSGLNSANGSSTVDVPGTVDGTRAFPAFFTAGTGTSTLFSSYSLTCDSDNPCDLVVAVFSSVADYQSKVLPYKVKGKVVGLASAIQSYPMTFLPFGAQLGCGGVSPDAIQTSSVERLGQSIVDWSRSACQSKAVGGGQAPTSNALLPEGGPASAVDDFAQGVADLAYAAGGYDLSGFSEPTQRPYVAVPIALNSVVVAAGGVTAGNGFGGQQAGTQFPTLSITADQAASIFGEDYLSPSLATELAAQNPAANGSLLVNPSYVNYSSTQEPGAVAGTDATTDFASQFFTGEAGQYWNAGPVAKFAPRGLYSSFGQPPASEPSFPIGSLLSHRTDVEKVALPTLYGINFGIPWWVLLDGATATQLGLSVAAIASDEPSSENGFGNGGDVFVKPTVQSMQAAVPYMSAQADGTATPNSAAVIAADLAAASVIPGPKQKPPVYAYPLTFVEYALAPTQPLVDGNCNLRPGSEQLLKQWLNFLVGAGQASLAPGLAPLTPTLVAQAQAAIGKVGSAPLTGCAITGSTTTAPAASTTTPSTSTATSGVSASSGFSGVGFGESGFGFTPTAEPGGSGGSGSEAVDSGGHVGAGDGGGGDTSASTRLAGVIIPGFRGASKSGWGGPAGSVVLIAGLMGLMALWNSGWSPGRLIASAVGRLSGRRRQR